MIVSYVNSSRLALAQSLLKFLFSAHVIYLRIQNFELRLERFRCLFILSMMSVQRSPRYLLRIFKLRTNTLLWVLSSLARANVLHMLDSAQTS